MKEAEKYKAADEEYRHKAKAMNDLDKYAFEMKRMLRCHWRKIGLKGKRKMGDAVDQTIQWLDWNSLLAEASKFEEKMKELESICEPIVKKIYTNLDADAASVEASISVPKIEIIELD